MYMLYIDGVENRLIISIFIRNLLHYDILRIEFFFPDWNSFANTGKKKHTLQYVNRDNFMYDFYYRRLINVYLVINYMFSK